MVLVALSNLLSPVPRTGQVPLSLGPMWLGVPIVVAWCWRHPAARLWGLRGMAWLGGGISFWALWVRGMDFTAPAAMPLGHHNLLAAFLLAQLPLIAELWKGQKGDRGLSLVAGVCVVGALWACRSLGAALALGTMIALGLWRMRPERFTARVPLGKWSTARWASGLGASVIGIVFLQRERLAAILAGSDVSTRARWSYWQAAWDGWLERPWLGWGPGSAHWTVGEHLRPIPAVHPPGQIVTDFHNLPFQLLYELGVLGCAALVLWGFYVLRPGNGRPRSDGAGLGLTGLAIFSCTGLPLDVPAIPMMVAVLIGAYLAGTMSDASEAMADALPQTPPPKARAVLRILVASTLLALSVTSQVPRDLAHLAYDRYLDTGPSELGLASLQRAVELDPGMPIYRWRLGLKTDDAEALNRAAVDALGIWPVMLDWPERNARAG